MIKKLKLEEGLNSPPPLARKNPYFPSILELPDTELP